MKYEMIFGDERLFFDAQQDCEMVGNGHHKVENGKLMVWNFSEKYWAESHTNKITIAAMRRIIKEPKRWTLEDKKAAIEAAICELHRQAVIPVVCPHCGAEYADFTHEAEFVGWNGVCAKCVLVGGVEI